MPFHCTLDEEMKLYPVIVTVSEFPPCVAEFGLREVIAGTGFDGGCPPPEPPPELPPDPDPLPHPAMTIENVRAVIARMFGTNMAGRTNTSRKATVEAHLLGLS